MPERNRNQYKWFIVAGASILVLYAALPTTGSSPKWHAPPDGSQLSKWRCLKRRDILRNSDGRIRWFSSSELIERVVEKQSVQRPGTLGKNNLRGVAIVQVVIDKSGKVICARGVEGNPVGLASAVRSVGKWTFRPYISNGKRKSTVGTLSIPYDFGG